MQMFSGKPQFDLAEFLAKPATKDEIKRLTTYRRRERDHLDKIEEARKRAADRTK